MWTVESTPEFEEWFESLDASEQHSVAQGVDGLEAGGPFQGRPLVDTLKGSRHRNMKELRVQHRGDPYRIFFAFDPRRVAILLIGGNKANDERFYKRLMPVAERLYDEHLNKLRQRGDI